MFKNGEAKNPGGMEQGLGESVTHGSSNDQKMVKEKMRTIQEFVNVV